MGHYAKQIRSMVDARICISALRGPQLHSLFESKTRGRCIAGAQTTILFAGRRVNQFPIVGIFCKGGCVRGQVPWLCWSCGGCDASIPRGAFPARKPLRAETATLFLRCLASLTI